MTFEQLFKNACPRDGDIYWNYIVGAYAHRPYHNLDHLDDILSELNAYNRVPGLIGSNLILAIAYHDYVYIPGHPDNEELSAAVAAMHMVYMNMGYDNIRKVIKYIQVTKTHELSEDPVANLFSDADMAGLATGYYVVNSRNIRQEFKNISDNDYHVGRLRFLKELITRKRIYLTKYFYDKYEDLARINIQKEIKQLETI